MKVSWDDDIPTEWKVIKFHGSKPPIRWWFKTPVSATETHWANQPGSVGSPLKIRPTLGRSPPTLLESKHTLEITNIRGIFSLYLPVKSRFFGLWMTLDDFGTPKMRRSKYPNADPNPQTRRNRNSTWATATLGSPLIQLIQYLEVSQNRGPPNHPFDFRLSLINHPLWGNPIFIPHFRGPVHINDTPNSETHGSHPVGDGMARVFRPGCEANWIHRKVAMSPIGKAQKWWIHGQKVDADEEDWKKTWSFRMRI